MPCPHATTILLVEPLKPVRMLMAQELEKAGYRVLAVSCGREGLEALEHTPPHLALLDGPSLRIFELELIGRLIGDGDGVPVILLQEPEVEATAVFGAQNVQFIPKQPDMGPLKELISDLLATRQAAEASVSALELRQDRTRRDYLP